MEAGVGTQQLTPELDTDENLNLISLFHPSFKQKNTEGSMRKHGHQHLGTLLGGTKIWYRLQHCLFHLYMRS